MELFIPEQFIEARRKMQERHRDLSVIPYGEFSDETRNLVVRMYEVCGGMEKAAALSLSDREVKLLAGYLPYNFFGASQGKLFEILRYRLDRSACETLFLQWQESFDNPECNEYLKGLTLSDEAFQSYLQEIHIQQKVFLIILSSRYIPLSFAEELVGSHTDNGMDFYETLQYYGVAEGSYLDIECKRTLLAFCSKADYFNCSEENILEIIKSYDEFLLKKFLTNFLDKLTLGELQIYIHVAAYLRSILGHRKTETFQNFFAGSDPEMVQKYLDWINLYKINTYFEDDDRSRFWKQYRYMNVIRYPVSDVVILEFESCIAVEFLGEKKGTIYLCEKDVFRQIFYEKLDVMNNEDLRLFFKINKEQCIEYRNHSGRWQSHIGAVLAKRQIAERIKI